ncbi:hypothetical protein [Aporhodopirellula aestuarii]|uniref:Uncharacterized protein n=1 Tax=Aporhodopirellula aestuarii TaxID=2950107 RepID=A0ABT0U7U5_9BACT|nr:hypothetical protein [Aporhodopirellula aestuarii]MCM2372625.1 hypothetical protein [Aporhodopirellula aestuarii]
MKLNAGVLMLFVALSPGLAAADWRDRISSRTESGSEKVEEPLFDFPISRALGVKVPVHIMKARGERTFSVPLAPFFMFPADHEFDARVAPVVDFPDKSDANHWDGFPMATR